MADNLTKTQRSYCMSRVKGKDTLLERSVRSALHRRGYRFRKHVSSLPGKPDIVFPSRRVAVFVDGDFWHGWRYSQWRKKLTPWWRTKIEATRIRDRRNHRRLRAMGWTVIRVWQHQMDRCLDEVINRIAFTSDSSWVRASTQWYERVFGLHSDTRETPFEVPASELATAKTLDWQEHKANGKLAHATLDGTLLRIWSYQDQAIDSLSAACAAAGRNLTDAEQQKYFARSLPRPTCDLPVVRRIEDRSN